MSSFKSFRSGDFPRECFGLRQIFLIRTASVCEQERPSALEYLLRDGDVLSREYPPDFIRRRSVPGRGPEYHNRLDFPALDFAQKLAQGAVNLTGIHGRADEKGIDPAYFARLV
jgi:hypothetical protein